MEMSFELAWKVARQGFVGRVSCSRVTLIRVALEQNYILKATSVERERVTVHQLISNPFLADRVFRPLGLTAMSWYVVGLDTRWTGKKPGDVDIIAGQLKWTDPGRLEDAPLDVREMSHERLWLAENGGIAWPPDLEGLVGVEVKCGYFENGEARSTKSSRKKAEEIQDQINGLLAMGLDRVALLDVIATHPSDGVGSQPWSNAQVEAGNALRAADRFIGERLATDSPAGHFVVSVGSVVGGDEMYRGALSSRTIRLPQPNPRAEDPAGQPIRQALTRQLHELLTLLPQPRHFPVVLIHCPRCRQVHHTQYSCG